MLLQNPPQDQEDLHQVITCQTHPNEPTIYGGETSSCSQPPNAFCCILLPGPNQLEVKASENTQFILSFVYASDQYGYGALTTPQAARDIEVKQAQSASDWTVTPNTNAENPS